MIQTVLDTSDVTIRAVSPLRHICPHVEEVDSGRIAIEWRCVGRTLELHSLRGWLDLFKDSAMSHESITDLIRHELSTIDGIELLSVATFWITAGMGIGCFTSPTRADLR